MIYLTLMSSKSIFSFLSFLNYSGHALLPTEWSPSASSVIMHNLKRNMIFCLCILSVAIFLNTGRMNTKCRNWKPDFTCVFNFWSSKKMTLRISAKSYITWPKSLLHQNLMFANLVKFFAMVKPRALYTYIINAIKPPIKTCDGTHLQLNTIKIYD